MEKTAYERRICDWSSDVCSSDLGLFGGLSAIGLDEVSSERKSADSGLSFGAPGWQQQWRPEFDVTPAYNPRSTLVPVARIEGLSRSEERRIGTECVSAV